MSLAFIPLTNGQTFESWATDLMVALNNFDVQSPYATGWREWTDRLLEYYEGLPLNDGFGEWQGWAEQALGILEN